MLVLAMALGITQESEAEAVTMLGSVYEISVGEKMQETAVPWREAKKVTEQALQRGKPIDEKNIPAELAAAGERKAKEYGKVLERMAEEEGLDELELAAVFQGNQGRTRWPKVQELHNCMVGINHLLDTFLRGPAKRLEKPSNNMGSKEQNREENPTTPPTKKPTSMEW